MLLGDAVTPGAVLCGFYGRSNLGDEAILSGLLGLLASARPDERALVLSDDPGATSRDHAVRAVSSRGMDVAWPPSKGSARLARAVLTRRDFVLGGGDLLRDSPQQDVVASWLSKLQLAQRLKRRTAVVGISVGHVWRPTSVARIRSALAGVAFAVVRDEASRQRLLDMDVQAPVHVGPDLALRVFPRRAPRPAVEGSPRVIVSVRGLADRSDPASAATHARALQQLADALDSLAADGARIELVPLRSREDRLQPVDDDYVASLELAHLAERGHRFAVHRHVGTVTELRDLLSDADLVIGMRLHSVIMAVGLGVPVVALSYDAKVTQFCAEVGLEACVASEEVEARQLVSWARTALTSGPAAADPAQLAEYRSRERITEQLLATW